MTKAKAAGRFDRVKLEAVAARVRRDEMSAALTVAAGSRNPDPKRWPTLSFNSFDVAGGSAAVSPDCSWRLFEAAIGSATKTIVAYVYNIGSADIVALLRNRLAAGVHVRIMVDPNDPNDGRSQEFAKLQELRSVGNLEISLSPSSSARAVFSVCHQKFVVVDGRIIVMGSANWAASAIPQAKAGEYVPGNREWLIRIDDVQVGKWFERLFEVDWALPQNLQTATTSTLEVDAVLEFAALFVRPSTLFDVEVAQKAFRVTPVISPNNYLTSVRKLLSRARKRIWLQQQYITAGDGVNELLEVVHDKVSSCDVRIIASPKFRKNWVNTMDTLKAAGLLDHLRAQDLSHVIHCHNKGVLVDDTHVVVSSTNWSENSITRARETGLLIDSRQLTAYFGSVFELDWKDALLPGQVAARTIAVSATDMV